MVQLKTGQESLPVLSRGESPLLPLPYLDTVWLQVAGTLCNIACKHCFISCGPKVHIHEMMTVAQVEEALAEGKRLGVRGWYFTGGEPFLHPDILHLVEKTLGQGPLGILTNGLLLDEKTVDALAILEARSPYSLELRVSLDGFAAATNDSIRGRGTFERIVASLLRLERAGLSAVVTVAEVHPELAGDEARPSFLAQMREWGVEKPRVKFLPSLKMGREAKRTRGYAPGEGLRGETLDSESPYRLVCGTSRTVTERGVWTCPLLVNDDRGRMGNSLADSLGPVSLRWPTCHTCQVEGLRCAT